jgi:hypothetical protein
MVIFVASRRRSVWGRMGFDFVDRELNGFEIHFIGTQLSATNAG